MLLFLLSNVLSSFLGLLDKKGPKAAPQQSNWLADHIPHIAGGLLCFGLFVVLALVAIGLLIFALRRRKRGQPLVAARPATPQQLAVRQPAGAVVTMALDLVQAKAIDQIKQDRQQAERELELAKRRAEELTTSMLAKRMEYPTVPFTSEEKS